MGADDDRGEGAAAVDELELGVEEDADPVADAVADPGAGAEEGSAADDAMPVPLLPPPPHPAKPAKAALDRHHAKPRHLLFSTIRTSLFEERHAL